MKRRHDRKRTRPTTVTVEPCAVCGRPVIEGLVFTCIECGDLVPVHLGDCERQLRVMLFPHSA